MSDIISPVNEIEVLDAVAVALAEDSPVEVVAGASKRSLGRHAPPGRRLDLSALNGITMYEPEELVVTTQPATPIADIAARLDQHHQLLAFEPPDYGPLLGGPAGKATVGGILACNLAGPRRIQAGAARDHFLGVRAVSGRGELFKSGGRVVKNVTGYDMCKLIAGSYGTLAAMTEVTLKVLPAPEKIRTVLTFGLDDAAAIRAMTAALQSGNDASAAAHLPAAIASRSGVSYVAASGKTVTAVRIEGTEPSVAARCESLRANLAAFGEIEELHRHNSVAFWKEVADVAPFAGTEGVVWRLSVPPSAGAAVAAAVLRDLPGTAYYDWGGGLVWLSLADSADIGYAVVRGALAECGGHATLIRATPEQRAACPVFQPQPMSLSALTERIKDGFDPRRILNPGRMYEGL